VQPVSASGDSPWTISTGQQAPEFVDGLLRSLPEWFGIESSNSGYVESAKELPTYLAHPAGDDGQAPVGVLLAARHFPGAAEIYLLAVDRSLHRSGVGRALLDALERDLIADGVTYLQVKTLGPSHPDPNYVKTRLFYESLGFAPLEENHDLWPANPCLIMIKVLPTPEPKVYPRTCS
jgi:ribosomal protein S18 acetylase RimI-like enzyme